MANLEDYLPNNVVETDISKKIRSKIDHNNAGKKRRVWLDEPVIIDKKPSLKNENSTITKPLINSKKEIKNINLSKLRGIPLKISLYFFSRVKIKDTYKTERICMKQIMEELRISRSSGRVGLRFLIKNNVINRVEFVAGRNGWSKYKFRIDVFKDIEEALINGKLKPHTYLSDKKEILQKDEKSSKNILSIGFDSINFENLHDYGFKQNHIQQIANFGIISPEELQQAIDFFVFDLEENDKAKEIKKSPVDFFMGILRRQGFYNAPKNYESPKDRALRLKLEQAKVQQEKRQKMEDELVEVEFSEWKSKITEDEKNKIMPERVKESRFEAEKESFLKKYFKDKYWFDIQQEKYADCF